MEKGDTNGRWGTMVTISAGSPAYAAIVRWGWAWRRCLRNTLGPLRFKGPPYVTNLHKLAMIGFARWSMIDRVPTGVPKPQASPLRRPFLLFETNFNGDADAYFEAFAYVLPDPINRVWDGGYDVPSAQPVSKWLRAIHANSRDIAYYYSAYPQASTKMIRSALIFERMLVDFRPRAANMTADQFDRGFWALLGDVERIRQPPKLPPRDTKTASLTTLIPVREGLYKQLEQALPTLDEPPTPLPATTHFARWCLLDRLVMPEKFGVDPRSYLLFSAWFDGDNDAEDKEREAAYAAALYQHLGPARARDIWGKCGFEGKDAGTFARFLMTYRVESDSAFAGYDGVSVDEVHRVLELRAHFGQFARDSQAEDRNGETLQKAWVDDPVLSRGT